MKPDIAVIGCGAVAQAFYLPAIGRMRQQFGEIWLVDPDDRVRAAAGTLVEARAARSLEDVPGNLTMAIIAAPNKLHFPLAQEAIQRGAHLLIEKPIVIWPDEGNALLALAAARQRVLAVNQTRRFIPYARNLRHHMQANAFGRLTAITHYEGQKLSWPYESGAAFQRNAQRTGVIMDLGVHVIDFYHFLFKPDWRVISAKHDGFCGPESLAEIELRADGVPVSIRLSRYQKQSNVARLYFEKANVTVDLEGLNTFAVQGHQGATRFEKAASTVFSYNSLADDVLSDFLAAAGGSTMPVCPAQSSLAVIAVLDEIYRSATTYPFEIGTV